VARAGLVRKAWPDCLFLVELGRRYAQLDVISRARARRWRAGGARGGRVHPDARIGAMPHLEPDPDHVRGGTGYSRELEAIKSLTAGTLAH
jgi:hypothetical protein